MEESPAALRVIVAAAAIGCGAALIASGLPLCPMALIFHVPCPGCGLSRAVLALAHGDVAGALRFHPLVLVAAPAAALGGAAAIFEYVAPARAAQRGWWQDYAAPHLSNAAALLLVLMVFVWLIRFFGALGGPVSV